MNNWMERAQSAEAQLATLKGVMQPTLDRVKEFKANFGVKERSNGEIDVDLQKFVENIGPETAQELKKIIDEVY